MNKFLLKLAAPLIIGLFSIACNFILGGSGSNSPSGGNAPDSFQVPSNSGGQSPASGNGKISIQLPSSPDIPPADVMQQITLSPGGGSGIICSSNCTLYDQKYTISLYYFQPNQQLRIDFYSYVENSNFEFLTEITVQADNNGAFDVHIDQYNASFLLIVLDEDGNITLENENLFVKFPAFASEENILNMKMLGFKEQETRHFSSDKSILLNLEQIKEVLSKEKELL